MIKSRVISKLLGAEEKVVREFGFSLRYRYFKFFLTLFQWILGLGLLFVLLNFLSAQNRPDFARVGEINSNLYGSDTGASSYGVVSPFSSLNASGTYLDISQEALGWLLIALILVFLFIVLPLNLFYYFFFLPISHEFMFTQERILVKRGWLNIQTVSIQYARITDVSISQTLIDRLLHIGALSVSTAGNEGNRIIMAHIDEPRARKRELHELKEKYRRSFSSEQAQSELVDSSD